jgi:hypothetical protein
MLTRPDYRMRFLASAADPAGWEKEWGRAAGPRVLRIETVASMSSLASSTRIRLAGPADPVVKPGSRFSLEIDAGRAAISAALPGAPDASSNLVMKGVVTGGAGGPAPTLECESRLGRLERSRANLSLSARTLNEAISRLVKEHRTIRFAPGSPAPSRLLKGRLTFDDSLSIADHVRRLSALAGFIAYTTPEDTLFVGPWEPLKGARAPKTPPHRQVTHEIKPESVLCAEVEPLPKRRASHGFTFSRPTDRNEGILVDSRKAVDPQVAGKLRPGAEALVEGLSPNSAKRALENLFILQDAGARVRLETLGAPEVRIGDAVRFKGIGPAMVTEVRHALDGDRGFTTLITGSVLRSPPSPPKKN